MVVNIQIEGAPKTLDQRDCASPCRGFGVTGLAGQMRGYGAIGDTEYLTHDSGLTGKQKAQWKRYTQHPLAHGLMRQDFIYQQSSAVGHTARTAAGAETAAFAAESDQFFIMAGLTANPQEAMLQPAALQILIKFLRDVGW